MVRNRKLRLIQTVACLFLFINSCSTAKRNMLYTDTFPPVEYNKLIAVRTIIAEDTITYTDPNFIQKIPAAINNSVYDGLWKTPYWDELQLIYADSTKSYKTNGFVFSPSYSIFFYQLPEELQKLWFQE